MKLDPETIDASLQEWEALLDGACHQTLNAADHSKLREVVKTMGQMARMLADKDATLRQLRQMLLKPAATEKTRAVLERAGIQPDTSEPAKPAAEKKKRKGHGRNPARAYEAARKVKVAHPEMKPGDRCPECLKGKVYRLNVPAVRVRIVGQAPVQATVYELEQLRCNLCGEVTSRPHPRKWERKSATRRRRAWWRY
jgi:transposase